MTGRSLIVVEPHKHGADPGDHQSAAKAIAKLQEDLEKIESKLNHERFCFITFIIAMFDALAFAFYKTWAGPVCLVAIQFAGLFVLARHLKVSEIVTLAFEIVRSWGKREKDPA